jgi:uncharacterized membrane protein
LPYAVFSSPAWLSPDLLKHVKKSHLLFVAIFAATFAMRLLQLASMGPAASVEENRHENWMIAQNILAGNGFSLNGVGPTAHKPPVYPFFLVFMIRTFGAEPFLAIRVLQAGIFAAATAMAFVLFQTVVSARLAFVATVLMAVSPFLRKVHIWIDSVSFSVLAILVVLLLAIRAQREPARVGRSFVLGLASGFLVLTLATASAMVPVILVWLNRNVAKGLRVRCCGLFLVGILMAVAPWTVRNAVAFGRLIPATSNLKLEIWIGSNPDATG